MLNTLFNATPFKAIDNAYPGKFYPWEFNRVPNNYWNLETAKKATIWLFEKKLKNNEEQIKNNMSKIFKNNGLGSMVTIVFNGNYFSAIDNAYNGNFEKIEFKYLPKNYWNLETAKKATIWLFEEKLKWGDEQIKANLSLKLFIDNDLGYMINHLFNNSPFKAIDNAYPGKFHPWEFNWTPRNFWNLETAKEATIWLFEKKLKWDDEMIKTNISTRVFKENKLGGMLRIVFNNNCFKAINNAYDSRFKIEDFNK